MITIAIAALRHCRHYYYTAAIAATLDAADAISPL